ncbi:MAG: AMP-binding protein, partial [bacterium]|nr:AMP-binding protein [bacterium]
MTTTPNDPQIDVFGFLDHLRQHEVEVWAEGERLRFSAPKGALTPELRSELARRKSEILALLHTAGDRGSVSLERVSRTGELPLSFSQLRLWFLEQFEPGTVAFHMPEAVRLTGPLDVVALRRSLRGIVSRHESLRTTFGAVEGRPVQVIAPEPRIELAVVDLRALPREERERQAEGLALVAARTCFDLERGPLVRTVLLRLDEAEHIFLITFHHLVFDRWSMGVFLGEMAALYKAFSSGADARTGPSPLPELTIQYVDFAHWQRRWLEGEVREALLDHWRRQLADGPEILALSTVRSRPPIRTETGARRPVVLSAALTAALKKLCRERDVSLFMVLLAACKVLLWRWTGQPDLSVGTVIANRNRPELEPLIGFLLNTLVLRTDLRGAPGFDALLDRVREVALGAFAHQELPFEQLIEELQPERELSYAPFFQVMVVVQNTPTPGIELAGLEAELLDYEGVVTANSDLGFWLWEDGDEIGGYTEYNTDLFDTVTILRMFEQLRSLLEAVARDPARSISRLPILSPAARHQLFGEWNDVPAPARGEECFHQLFEARAERTPELVALTFEEVELNYGELNARANRLARYLRRLGVGPEIGVGVFLDYSPEMVVAALGVMKSGGAFLPLDATHTRQRIGELLEGAEVAALLTQEGLRGDLPATFQPRVVCLDADWEEISRESGENLPCLARPSNLVYRVYTSGTTGRPKGVMISHAALLNLFHGHRLGYGPDGDIAHPQMASFSFGVCVGGMPRPSGTGGRLVM